MTGSVQVITAEVIRDLRRRGEGHKANKLLQAYYKSKKENKIQYKKELLNIKRKKERHKKKMEPKYYIKCYNCKETNYYTVHLCTKCGVALNRLK